MDEPVILEATEVINSIYDVLCQADGEFIEQIANQVLTRKVKYKEDSLFEEIEN